MKNKSFFAILVCFAFLLITVVNSVNLVYGTNPDTYIECLSSAKSMCVIEQSSNRVLYGKDIHKKLPMASTTKIFTALTVLENCNDLSQKVKIDNRAVGIEGTSIYLRQGEVLTVKELLLGMMLPSGNDSATALAYFIGKDVPKFCKLMEQTAKNAGAINSSFKNAHGLDEVGHYTTAYDLSIVSAKALLNPVFKEISQTKTAIISGNSEVKSRYLKNKNKLLNSFEGCNGIKTGFTDNAGRCFVSSATRDNMTVVCTVLNCQPMFEECAKFMEMAFKNFTLTELVPQYDIIDSIQVKNGREKFVKVFSRKSFSYPLTEDEKLQINYCYDLPKVINAPIPKEEVVGKIKVYLGEKQLFEDEVLTRDNVKKDSIFSYFNDVISFW